MRRDGVDGTSDKGIYNFALHPLYILSFCIMLLNDIFLKPSGVLPLIAGKLSDIAILIFLPAAGALLSVYVRYLKHLLFSNDSSFNGLLLIEAKFSVIITGVIFTLLQLSAAVNELYVDFINNINILSFYYPYLSHTMDPSDLATLPFSLISYMIMKRSVIN